MFKIKHYRYYKKIDNLKIEIKHEIGQLHGKTHQINTNNRNEFLKEIKAYINLEILDVIRFFLIF